jgi:hypothetical protein
MPDNPVPSCDLAEMRRELADLRRLMDGALIEIEWLRDSLDQLRREAN